VTLGLVQLDLCVHRHCSTTRANAHKRGRSPSPLQCISSHARFMMAIKSFCRPNYLSPVHTASIIAYFGEQA